MFISAARQMSTNVVIDFKRADSSVGIDGVRAHHSQGLHGGPRPLLGEPEQPEGIEVVSLGLTEQTRGVPEIPSLDTDPDLHHAAVRQAVRTLG